MINEMKGRCQEMFDLISNLCDGQRLTQLVGLPAIGKSCLTRAAIKYISERRIFLGGIVFVQGKGIQTLKVLVKEILIKFLQNSTSQKSEERIGDICRGPLEEQINWVIG